MFEVADRAEHNARMTDELIDVLVTGYHPTAHVLTLRCTPSASEPAAVAVATAFAAGPNPSYAAITPTGDAIIVVNETSDGGVSAFALEHPGVGRIHVKCGTAAAAAPHPVDRPATYVPVHGDDPCHVAVHPSGKWAVVSCYSSGSIAVFRIVYTRDGVALEPATGEVSVAPHMHSSPSLPSAPMHAHVLYPGMNAHQAVFSPDGTRVCVCALGDSRIVTYTFDVDTGALRPDSPAFIQLTRCVNSSWLRRSTPGPRHLALHPSGSHAYVMNELDVSVTRLARDAATGRLEHVAASTGVDVEDVVSSLPAEPTPGAHAHAHAHTPFSGAHIEVSSDASVLFVSNRGINNIVAMPLMPTDDGSIRVGAPIASSPPHACIATPRDFTLLPGAGGRDVLIVANQASDSLTVLRWSGTAFDVLAIVPLPAGSKPTFVKVLPLTRTG